MGETEVTLPGVAVVESLAVFSLSFLEALGLRDFEVVLGVLIRCRNIPQRPLLTSSSGKSEESIDSAEAGCESGVASA
jgi:hypothetical protein